MLVPLDLGAQYGLCAGNILPLFNNGIINAQGECERNSHLNFRVTAKIIEVPVCLAYDSRPWFHQFCNSQMVVGQFCVFLRGQLVVW